MRQRGRAKRTAREEKEHEEMERRIQGFSSLYVSQPRMLFFLVGQRLPVNVLVVSVAYVYRSTSRTAAMRWRDDAFMTLSNLNLRVPLTAIANNQKDKKMQDGR